MSTEELHRLLKNREFTIEDVIDAIIFLNGIVGVGKITLGDTIKDYCYHKAKDYSGKGRVNAIATIHASLYLDGDVTSVAVDQQLRDLCDHVAASSGCDVRGITIKIKVQFEDSLEPIPSASTTNVFSVFDPF